MRKLKDSNVLIMPKSDSKELEQRVEDLQGVLHKFRDSVRLEADRPDFFWARQRNAIMAAFVSLAFVKTVTVVDEDVDIYNPADVDLAVQTRCRFESDLLLIPDAIGHRLNPMVEKDKWTRLGIDATVPLPRPDRFTRATMKEVDLSRYEITGG